MTKGLFRSILSPIKVLHLIVPHLCLLYCILHLLMNTSLTMPIFNATVNSLFSGGIYWEKLRFGPYPWQVQIIEPKLITADQKVVVHAKLMSIDRFDYTSLWQDGVKGHGIRIVDLKVDLAERDSLIFQERLWNIAELFFSLENRIDDGELPEPMDLDFREIDIENADIHLKMPVIELHVHQMYLKNAFFHFLVDQKKMYMGALETKASDVDVDIYLLDDVSATSATPAIPVKSPPVIHYELADLTIDQFFWRDQDFGATRLQLKSFDHDLLTSQNLMMSMIKGATPQMVMDFTADLKDTGLYLKTWDLDQKIDGELVAKGHLFGPVSNFKGQLEASGRFRQLFNIPIDHYRLEFNKLVDDMIDLHTLEIKQNQQEGGLITATGHYHPYLLNGNLTIEVHDEKWHRWLSTDLLSKLKLYTPWLKPVNGSIHIQTYAKVNQIGLIPNLLLSLQLNSKTPHPLEIKSTIRLEDQKVWIDQNSIEIDQLHQKLLSLFTQGYLDLNPFSIDLSNDLQVNVNANGSEKIPIKLPIKGKVNASVLLKGTTNDLHYDLDLQAKNLELLLLSAIKIDEIQATAKGDLKEVQLSTNGKLLNGHFEASFAHQLKKPDQFKGWYYIHQVSLRLDEWLPELKKKDLSFETKFSTMGCALFHGCLDLYSKKKEIIQSFDQYQCVTKSKERMSDPITFAEEIHFCTHLDQPKYQALEVDQIDLSYQWNQNHLNIEHGLMIQDDEKLLDLKGNLDLKHEKINGFSAKLSHFPLNQLQLALPNPPFMIKTLQGALNLDLNLSGSFQQINADSVLDLPKVSFQIPKEEDVLNIRLGQTNVKFKLNADILDISGKFGDIIDFNTVLPIKKKEEIQEAELQLYINQLNTSYLKAIPTNEESYLEEHQELSTFIKEDHFGAISLMDATEGLSFLGIGKHFYCTAQSLNLANGQLLHSLIDGIVRVKFDPFFRKMPNIHATFKKFQIDYSLRDDNGLLIKLPNASSCENICIKESKICPTISLKTDEDIEFELLKYQDQLFAYFNTSEKTIAPDESIAPAQTATIEICEKDFEVNGLIVPSVKPTKEIKAQPIILGNHSQKLIFGGYMIGDQVNACLSADFDLGVLYPFLNHIYQKIEGSSKIVTAIYGKIDSPKVNGFLDISDMSLLSPRSQIVGEFGFTDHFKIFMEPLNEGGFMMINQTNQIPIFKWNNGEFQVKNFQILLPNFEFRKLSLSFNASQLEINLPETVFLNAQLQDMEFEFLRNGPLISDQTLKLSGDIELLRGIYRENIQGVNELNEGFRNNISGKSKVKTLSVFEKIPLLQRVFLNLRVRSENDFFIRNQVAILQLNLEIAMDLRVKGYLYSLESAPLSEQLRLSGELKTLSGSKITYANRPFDVIDGIIRFGDGLNTGQTGGFLNANLQATHTFRIPKTAMRGRQLTVDQSNAGELIEEEVTLRTKVEMPSKNAKPIIDFSLSSPSGASKLELATLVLTGRFPSKVSTTTSAQPATEVLLSPLLNLIERPIEDTLNLDLSLTPDTSGMLFVDLNKIFSRRLRLYARTPIGDDQKSNPQIFSLEYRFNNLIYGEISNERINQISSTSGRFRLRLSWESF